jgi:tetratricopeptide (TPR) repeat protein
MFAIKALLTFLLLTWSFKVFPQASVSSMLQKAKTLDETAHEEEALQEYLSILKLDPANNEATRNISLLYSKIGNREKESDNKKAYFKVASQYATNALKQNPSDAESNFCMAVALGRMALISSPKEKVAASRDIKKYAELALSFNPTHAGAWHVLGKWNYEVANLNFAERAAADYLFGGIPDGSLDEAVKDYIKAINSTRIIFFITSTSLMLLRTRNLSRMRKEY